MKKKVIVAAVLALTTVAAATAQPLPVPRQPGPGGACPVGYASSGSYCIPLGSNSPPAIPKPANGTCPIGWASSGSYCVRTL
jgi:hypothetical protein